jgi:hypothetical protein
MAVGWKETDDRTVQSGIELDPRHQQAPCTFACSRGLRAFQSRCRSRRTPCPHVVLASNRSRSWRSSISPMAKFRKLRAVGLGDHGRGVRRSDVVVCGQSRAASLHRQLADVGVVPGQFAAPAAPAPSHQSRPVSESNCSWAWRRTSARRPAIGGDAANLVHNHSFRSRRPAATPDGHAFRPFFDRPRAGVVAVLRPFALAGEAVNHRARSQPLQNSNPLKQVPRGLFRTMTARRERPLRCSVRFWTFWNSLLHRR